MGLVIERNFDFVVDLLLKVRGAGRILRLDSPAGAEEGGGQGKPGEVEDFHFHMTR
jgi:hypothetical protein